MNANQKVPKPKRIYFLITTLLIICFICSATALTVIFLDFSLEVFLASLLMIGFIVVPCMFVTSQCFKSKPVNFKVASIPMFLLAAFYFLTFFNQTVIARKDLMMVLLLVSLGGFIQYCEKSYQIYISKISSSPSYEKPFASWFEVARKQLKQLCLDVPKPLKIKLIGVALLLIFVVNLFGGSSHAGTYQCASKVGYKYTVLLEENGKATTTSRGLSLEGSWEEKYDNEAHIDIVDIHGNIDSFIIRKIDNQFVVPSPLFDDTCRKID